MIILRVWWSNAVWSNSLREPFAGAVSENEVLDAKTSRGASEEASLTRMSHERSFQTKFPNEDPKITNEDHSWVRVRITLCNIIVELCNVASSITTSNTYFINIKQAKLVRDAAEEKLLNSFRSSASSFWSSFGISSRNSSSSSLRSSLEVLYEVDLGQIRPEKPNSFFWSNFSSREELLFLAAVEFSRWPVWFN